METAKDNALYTIRNTLKSYVESYSNDSVTFRKGDRYATVYFVRRSEYAFLDIYRVKIDGYLDANFDLATARNVIISYLDIPDLL